MRFDRANLTPESPRAFHRGALLRIILAVAVLSTVATSLLLPTDTTHHFAYLARSFSRGVFSVNDLPAEYHDKIIVGREVYLPLAPMPGILLVPFNAIFGLAFDEIGLALVFTVANGLLTFVILKRLGIARQMRAWLIALFFCGTIYFSALVVGRSWFLAHIIATTFLLCAMDEVLSRRRAPLIGVWLGLAFLTRSPTVFSFPFFVWMLKPDAQSFLDRKWIVSTGAKLASGLALPGFFFLYYNYARFGNPLETGYGLATVGSPILAEAMRAGLFSPAHLAKNLYALVLAMPQPYPSFSAPMLTFPFLYPSPWGMGIFFTTPAFVYIWRADGRARIVRAAWLAIAFALVPLLLYYGIGWMQFGFRYALDLYPFLFLLTALGISTHPTRASFALIILSITINVWGAWWQMIGFRMLPLELQR